jgi:uncharacterized protein (TIGR02145 family)
MKTRIVYYLVIITGIIISIQIACKKELPQEIPSLVTINITDITANSLTSGGLVFSSGGDTVRSRGICLSTDIDPEVCDSSDIKTVDGTGTGGYTSYVSGLMPGTTYYIRAYATNVVGSGYGNQYVVTTKGELLSIKTTAVSSITSVAAVSGGNITGDGMPGITSRGVCWGTNSGPTIADNKTSDGSGLGEFASTITGLTTGTTYYVRAYATSVSGTFYGNEVTFKSECIPPAAPLAITGSATVDQNATGIVYSIAGVQGVSLYNWMVPSGAIIISGQGTTSVTVNFGSSGGNVSVRSERSCGSSVYTSLIVTVTVAGAIPVLTTKDITCGAFTSTTASGGGNITSDGGSAVTVRGVCWSTTNSPTTANSITSDGPGTGSFTSNLTGLTEGKTYYARAFATNSAGTAYGNEVSFTTIRTSFPNCGTVTDIDGNVYKTVTIGAQCWMAENLKTTKYRNGDPVPNVTDNTAWAALTTGAYAWFNNDGAYKASYGALYNWYSVADSRNVCPTGWHVASDEEWTTLTTFLGGESVAGGPLKETCFAHWISPNTGATNSTGFTALPGGYRDSNGSFSSIGWGGHWWGSTEKNPFMAWDRYFRTDVTDIDRYSEGFNKLLGFSVRCLKGEPVIIPTVPLLTTAEATGITVSMALSGGNITSDGGSFVTARGVCWSTVPSPTTVNNTSTDGPGAGIFSSTIAGLIPGTTYYARAYATNSAGTAYGNEVTFTTMCIFPADPAAITGNVSVAGNATGIVYSVSSVPGATSYNWSVPSGAAVASGQGTTVITVNFGTTGGNISVRAENSCGNSAYISLSICVLDAFTDSRDGKTYKFVHIGSQVWMAENLAYLPVVNPASDGSSADPYYYVYDYNGTDVATAKASANFSTYGVLYNWPAAMAGAASSNSNPSGVQGVCPTGWHLPGDDEWTILTTYLGGESVAGGKMKETGTVHWIDPNVGATNESCFSGLPGGYRYDAGLFANYLEYGWSWSSTEGSATKAWMRLLTSPNNFIIKENYSKSNGLSVRCVKDN